MSTRDLIILLIVVLVIGGSFPAWPHSREWGYRPFGIALTILLIVIVLKVLGVI